MTANAEPWSDALDPVFTTIIANRFDGIVREMSNTLMRSARSSVVAAARDFSCAIVTADGRLLATADGIPVHLYSMHLQAQSMTRLHPDLAAGDAYIHNDSYLGNTHSADQTLLVPVFAEGRHCFTVCAKAHQADIGNSIPTTYHAGARDVYEEGAVIFPCLRLQRDGRMNEEIIRMGRRRIRAPDQWYGDLLAAVGAARVGERRVQELMARYGGATIATFIERWFDYSARLMANAIAAMPAATVEHVVQHDAMPPFLPEPVAIRVRVTIEPEEPRITVDLRDNPDCLPCGLNQSEACATNNALVGVFNCVGGNIPLNAGSFRHIDVLLRDGCVVGRPTFPHSCSVATTNIADRLINAVHGAFAKLGEGHGLAEGSASLGAGVAVISGIDPRFGDRPYVNQLIVAANGGPASPAADGWVTYGAPVVAGMLNRDSVEIDELKHPMLFQSLKVVAGSGGAGRRRGGPGLEIIYGPLEASMTVIFACDCTASPPQGAHGGSAGALAANFLQRAGESEEPLAAFSVVTLQPGDRVRAVEAGGGGYDSPFLREPARVLDDVRLGIETVERARSVYGVPLIWSAAREEWSVDPAAADRNGLRE